MVVILMISAKLATQGLLKTKVFWNESHDVITSVNDVTKKILPSDSNYIVNVVMWPKFGNSNISMREVIIISVLSGFDQENRFWFKFNNLELAPGTNLKFYTSMAKGLKTKVKRFLGPILRL